LEDEELHVHGEEEKGRSPGDDEFFLEGEFIGVADGRGHDQGDGGEEEEGQIGDRGRAVKFLREGGREGGREGERVSESGRCWHSLPYAVNEKDGRMGTERGGREGGRAGGKEGGKEGPPAPGI
jgi:hypothetical protein